MKQAIHVWHLQITDLAGIKTIQTSSAPRKYELAQAQSNLPEFNRFLYVAVGASCQWYMRLGWTYATWQQFLEKPGVETWVAYLQGSPIGYFELEAQQTGSAEIVYFGLLPEFIGQGYGGQLLEDAIQRASQLAGKRVWLHTCTLDHPRALPNYLAHGFEIFAEEDLVDEIPDAPIQPWPGADKSQI